jgi:asparagine N-glycosylation enzyme membrane subunit Stt3
MTTQNNTGKLWSAFMFIILGLVLLIDEFFPAIDFEDFWPVLLIITGIIMIYDGWLSPKKDDTKID